MVRTTGSGPRFLRCMSTVNLSAGAISYWAVRGIIFGIFIQLTRASASIRRTGGFIREE